MWGPSSEVGVGGAGGGGFLTNSQFGSPSVQGSPKKKGGQTRALVPVTTAHIHQMPKDQINFKIGSKEVNMLVVVGVVTAIEELKSKIIYHVDDLTGPPLSVQLWLTEGDGSDKRASISENSYVRAVGSLRIHEDARLMIAFRVLPLLDLNDLTIHLLEVVRAHMILLRSPDANSTVAAMSGPIKSEVTSMDTSAAPYDSNMVSIMSGMTNHQRLVFQTILSSKSERGISLSELTSKIKALNQNVIRDIIDFLCNEGHIYTTIDDEHFRATEGS